MRLLLVRHGQTTGNVISSLDSLAPGPELTALGREQAEQLVTALEHEPIEALYVSTLVRTHQTVAPLARRLGLEPVERDGLREVTSGDLEGRSDDASVAAYLGHVDRWTTGDLDAAVPGGETGHDLVRRHDEVVAEIEATGASTVALVGHGSSLRVWASVRGRGVGPELANRHLTNTGVVVLEGSTSDGWVVESWLGEGLTDAARTPHADGPTAR